MTELALNRLPHTFSRQDLLDMLRRKRQDFSASSLSWYIRKLLEDDRIARIGNNLYCLADGHRQQAYAPVFMADTTQVLNDLAQEFDLAEFIVWESRQLNEFVNHQIARNLIYVEVEYMIADSVFYFLQEKYGQNVFLNPDEKEMTFYLQEGSIIVRRLVSMAPRQKKNRHLGTLEKLAVDLMVDKIVQAQLNMADIPEAVENIFAAYYIDETSMFRYADRRAAKKKVLEFIHTKTNIRLCTEE